MATSGDPGRRDAIIEQVFGGVIGALETLHVYLGDRLGLYAALAASADSSPGELAARAGIAQRYAREWLEQQAVAGLLDVVADGGGDPAARRYRLPPEVEEVMTDADSLNYLAPAAGAVAGISGVLPRLVDAFRTGSGVPYAAYGEDLRAAVARLNRPMFLRQLAAEWIPSMPDIEARLQAADQTSQVADVGCGTGWSTIAIAQAYPGARIDGIDLDEASIAEARRSAEAAGVADRVAFERRDAADLAIGGYDLVTFFETLHDMAHPVAALRAAAAALAPGGAVLVGDEKVAETFTAPGDELERFNYGWSAVHCLPAALTEPDSAATGTVMRPDSMRRYAEGAGFSSVSVLPVDHDLWRFYRLDP